MSERQGRYFWFRFMENFFSHPAHKLLEKRRKGKEYMLLYIKLMAIATNTEGFLRYRNLPLSIEDLSHLTDSTEDDLRNAVSVMKSLGLLEITPEEVYYLPEVPDLIGSETPDAKRKRQKKKEATISDDVPTNGGKNPENFRDTSAMFPAEKSNRESTEDNNYRESERDTPRAHELGEFNNVHLSDEEIKNLKSSYPSSWVDYVEKVSAYKKQHGVEYASDYAAITKWLREDGVPVEY